MTNFLFPRARTNMGDQNMSDIMAECLVYHKSSLNRLLDLIEVLLVEIIAAK